MRDALGTSRAGECRQEHVVRRGIARALGAVLIKCVECGEPLVTILERSRKVCSVCYLHDRPWADRHPPHREGDRSSYAREERRSESPDHEGRRADP
jgi:hypothetical protein